MVSLPDFACFVKALLAACLARDNRADAPFKISFATETSELATSRRFRRQNQGMVTIILPPWRPALIEPMSAVGSIATVLPCNPTVGL
jgi:hypothetical protein